MPDKIQSRRYKRGLKFCVGDTADRERKNLCQCYKTEDIYTNTTPYNYYSNCKEENAMNTDSISIKIKQADNRLDIIVFLMIGRQ